MGRAFYRFGHDVALRVPNGQAFALKDAELGAQFGAEGTVVCFLRGTFTTGTFRGLVARGLIPPHPQYQALAVPLAVQLNLKSELAAMVGKDAATLHHFGRRLDTNSLTDELARKLLLFEMWQLVSIAPFGQGTKALAIEPATTKPTPEQDAYLTQMITELANELLEVAAEAGEVAQGAYLHEPMPVEEAVKLFFEEEEWEWTIIEEPEGVLRTVYDGQNGSWMCYTRILPDMDQVVFYSICPVPFPVSVLPTLTEFLCRVNADLAIGNFEIDFERMVVRFRTSVDVTDVGLTSLMFRNLVFHNLVVMDINLPDILGIIGGRQSALPTFE